jgi:hypothetical protein
MCDEEANAIGELVPDDRMVFRGCNRKNFLTPAKDAVQPEAFHKKGKNHKDGLSVALTPIDSVRYLTKGNWGVIRIRVGDIHLLNRGLQVRFDLNDARHALIRNLACMDRGLEERAEAEATAAELAYRAQVESANPLIVPSANQPNVTPSNS